jgi:hypothetical protein
VAILLDDKAREVVARRRDRGKDDAISVRLERGPVRAYVPWIIAVGWAPRRWPDCAFPARHAGAAEIHADPRVVRYAHWRDLVITGARLGPWRWLAVADPFACDHMLEWEWSHPQDALPSVWPMDVVISSKETKAWLPDAS